MFVELVELVFGEDGAGRVVGIGQVNDLGVFVDGGGQRGQVVVPVAVGNGAVLDAARTGQHLEADKSCFGGEHFVLIAQEGADDVGHDTFRSAAGDDVFHLEIELLRQDFAQFEPDRKST